MYCFVFLNIYIIIYSELNVSLLCFLVQLQIEEVTRKLRTGDFGIPANPEERFAYFHYSLYLLFIGSKQL